MFTTFSVTIIPCKQSQRGVEFVITLLPCAHIGVGVVYPSFFLSITSISSHSFDARDLRFGTQIQKLSRPPPGTLTLPSALAHYGQTLNVRVLYAPSLS